jgi:hypothetical protein
VSKNKVDWQQAFFFNTISDCIILHKECQVFDYDTSSCRFTINSLKNRAVARMLVLGN